MWAALVAIALVALGVRLWALYTYQILDTSIRTDVYRTEPWSPLMHGDAWAYYDKGRTLVDEGDLGVPFQPPLTAIICGGCYWLFGDTYEPVKVVSSVVGAASCLLIGILGWQVASAPVGIGAALLTAFSFTQIPVSQSIGAEVFHTLLTAGFLVAMLGLRRRPGVFPAIGVGVIAALGQLNRSEFLLVVAFGLAAAAIAHRSKRFFFASLEPPSSLVEASPGGLSETTFIFIR